MPASSASAFRGEEPRERLIDAAAEICAERGYEEIAEEEIAERAAVPLPTLWALFSDGKEGCLAAAENTVLLEVVAAVGRGYSADRSEWENVIHGVKAILDLMGENPVFAYVGYVFARQLGPPRVREINKTGHRMLEAMLERGWDYSQSADQPAKAALGILGGAQAIVRRELVFGRAERLPLLLPDCVYIATVPFLGQREALRLAHQGQGLIVPPR